MMNITEVILDGDPVKLSFLITEMIKLNIPFAMKHVDGEVGMRAIPTVEQAQMLDKIVIALNDTDINIV